jgi:putative transposase
MQNFESLCDGSFYHIYNRGINSEPIFRQAGDYFYFLRLYEKYVTPIGKTYAWCLMETHFHMLLQVTYPDRVHLKFSHMFNSYAQAYNKSYLRHGGLFERPFKRKLVESEEYFKQLVLYIHNNPVNQGICEYPHEYQWSSYISYIEEADTQIKIDRETVLELFDSLENFKACHDIP